MLSLKSLISKFGLSILILKVSMETFQGIFLTLCGSFTFGGEIKNTTKLLLKMILIMFIIYFLMNNRLNNYTLIQKQFNKNNYK